MMGKKKMARNMRPNQKAAVAQAMLARMTPEQKKKAMMMVAMAARQRGR